jgi:hypothetical protein
LLGFGTNYFYGVELSAPRPTPNPEDQGIYFRLGHHPWPAGMGGHTINTYYHQHSSRVYMTTQAPPLRQSRDTFGGISEQVVLTKRHAYKW